MTVKMDDKLRFKIVFLGSSKVGKTSLIKKFLYNQFQEKYKETIEDLHSKECTVKVSKRRNRAVYRILQIVFF